MAKALSVVLVGIGGYGAMYCSAFRDPRLQDCRIVGAVDPCPSTPQNLAHLAAHNATVVTSIAELNDMPPADLAIIASPLQFHAEHTAELLRRGSNVLCEKPLCATLEQAAAMARARDVAGKHVAVGYQWSYSAAVQALKADIAAGVLGTPRRFRTLLLWPRDEKYYLRNGWAGHRFDAAGRPVHDSPVNNAAAHYLHNMLYLLGDRPDRSAVPERVTAELYRGHQIDNYDTAAIRCHVAGGVELLFLATHASTAYRGPTFVFEFEHATVRYEHERGARITAEFADGGVRDYGCPEESHYVKLFSILNSIRTGEPPVCGIEAAAAQTQVMLAALDSSGEPRRFPDSMVSWRGEPGERKVEVAGLDAALTEGYTAGKLPSELAIEWAVAGREVSVASWQAAEPELQVVNGHLKVATPTPVLPATAFQRGRPVRPVRQS